MHYSSMERPRKRQRISPENEEDRSTSGGEEENISHDIFSPPSEIDPDDDDDMKHDIIDNEDDDRMGGKFISFPAASLSRIKPKTTSETPSTPPRPTTSADDDNDNDGNDNDHLPTSIQLSLDPTANLTFADLGVDSWLVASLSRMAIRRPTRIQSACIPPLLSGRDCVGGSRTGSGKTVAFAVPLLQSWAKDPCGRLSRLPTLLLLCLSLTSNKLQASSLSFSLRPASWRCSSTNNSLPSVALPV